MRTRRRKGEPTEEPEHAEPEREFQRGVRVLLAAAGFLGAVSPEDARDGLVEEENKPEQVEEEEDLEQV